MIDFSHWKEYDGASEGSGRSEKIWLIEPDTRKVGLFKYKKDINTTDHISECIAYQLACLLNIECAKFELGTYKTREGSMSYNVIENPNQSLIEGINYIILKYPTYDVNILKDLATGKIYSLEMIQECLPATIPFKDFLKIPLFDYLIGNTDRHQNNWAFIMEDGTLRLSPLYDNSSSLCAYMNDHDLNACLGNDKLKWKSVVETKPRSIIRKTSNDTQKPTHLEVLRYLHDNYYSETIELAEKIAVSITADTIDKILSTFPNKQLSITKRTVIKRFLLSKVEKLNEVYILGGNPHGC